MNLKGNPVTATDAATGEHAREPARAPFQCLEVYTFFFLKKNRFIGPVLRAGLQQPGDVCGHLDYDKMSSTSIPSQISDGLL